MQLTWYEVIKYGDRRPLDEYPEDLDFCGPSGSADGVWRQTDKRPSPFEEGSSTFNSRLARCAPTGHKPSTKSLDRYASPFDKPRPCRTSISEIVGQPWLPPRDDPRRLKPREVLERIQINREVETKAMEKQLRIAKGKAKKRKEIEDKRRWDAYMARVKEEKQARKEEQVG